MVVCLSGSGGFLPQAPLPCSAIANMFPRPGGDSTADPWVRTDRAGPIDGSLLQHQARIDRWMDGRRSIVTSGKNSGRTGWRSMRMIANAEKSLPSRSDDPDLMLPIEAVADRAHCPIRGRVGVDLLWKWKRPKAYLNPVIYPAQRSASSKLLRD